VLLCFHPQGSDAGGLAVRLAVQLVAVEARAHPGRAKEATHVSLSHVAAGAGDAEELGDAAGCVGVSMGGHAGGHCLAGDDAGRHGGRGAVVADPGRVLDLEVGKEASGLPCEGRDHQPALLPQLGAALPLCTGRTDVPVGAELPAAPSAALAARCPSREHCLPRRRAEPCGAVARPSGLPQRQLIKRNCRGREGGPVRASGSRCAAAAGPGEQDERREEVSSWLQPESKGPFIPPPLGPL